MQGRIYALFMVYMNFWIFRQIRYFMYMFSKIGLILSVDSHTPKRLNDAPGWTHIYLFKVTLIDFHLALFLFSRFLWCTNTLEVLNLTLIWLQIWMALFTEKETTEFGGFNFIFADNMIFVIICFIFFLLVLLMNNRTSQTIHAPAKEWMGGKVIFS